MLSRRSLRWISEALPQYHDHRGTSVRRLLLFKARVLAKYLAQTATGERLTRQGLVQLRDLRGVGAGGEAIVIALGPSAENLDAAAIERAQAKGLKVISLNRFNQTKLANKIRPDFYVLADPFFFDMSSDESEASDVWRYARSCPGITVVVPAEFYDRARKHFPRIIPFDNRSLETFSRNISPERPRGYLGITAYTALSIASYMEFDRIYVSGLDNSQYRSLALTETGRVGLRAGAHSYNEGYDIRPLPYFRHGVAAFFEDVSRLFGDLSLFAGGEIVNLDAASVVDAFPVARDSGLVHRDLREGCDEQS